MKSDYLDRRERSIQNDVTREIGEIKKDILLRQPKDPIFSDSCKVAATAGFILGIILDFAVGQIGLGIACAAGGAVLGALYYFMGKGSCSAKRAALAKEEARRIAEAEENGRRRFAAEKAQFISDTTEARKQYGANAAKNAKKVINWLVQGFKTKIQTANREPHVRVVTAPFSFTVMENEILAEKMKFDFEKQRINSIKEFVNQVAFAQAMALILQYELQKLFPTDPSDKTGRRSEVTIAANDNHITLTYKAANGNYEHAVTL